MPASRSHATPSTAVCVTVVIGMLAMIVLPAGLTLHRVQIDPPAVPLNQSSTPNGYAMSLLLFIVSILVIALWFLPSERLHIPRRAFWWTLAILVPLGFLLDFVFAQWFFDYPNVSATLGIHAPALGRPVPLEEHVFYFTGFLADLLLYIWLGEFWVAAYNVIDYPGEARSVSKLLQFHPTSLILAYGMIGAAWFYKKHWALPMDKAGFPGYFAFLVTGALVPAVAAFPLAKRFINWRALSLTLFFMLLVSLLWEVTLDLPYQWWCFQHHQMIGLFIGAWSGLPIEEVFVWIAVTYATVIVYETVKVFIASRQSVRGTFELSSVKASDHQS